MKASKYVVIAVAGVAAIILAVLAQSLLSSKPKADEAHVTVKAEAPPPMIKVLVAARELKVGTRVTESDLMWLDWPLSAKVDSYRIKPDTANAVPLTDNPAQAAPSKDGKPAKDDKLKTVATQATEIGTTMLNPTGGMEDFIGGVVRETLQAHEPIISAKVVRANESGYLAVTLDPGLRAMAVPVSVETTAGGFILPGDHVDVMVSHQVPRAGAKGGGDDKIYIAETVLRNIKVLAIDQALEAKKDQQSALGATATLAVTPEQTQTLALAKSVGTITLLLRSYADISTQPGNTPPDQTGQGQGQARRNLVRVFRGENSNEASEVMVAR